ncbi:TetR/AcrR family transcriptional regulator [Microbacterium sediminicola]|uniref:TetR/AcrR family transcriptional regulator n=1 Tax=Microbacterium sediminicola TaxID=415210 RepID=A0ABN2ICK2_9MICO
MNTAAQHSSPASRPSSARARLLDAATELFYGEGIHAVGVDRIIETAGVTRATMYKQFGGKEALVVAYLEGEDRRLRELFAAATHQTAQPAALLELALQGIAADIALRHTRGCPFINAAAEYPDEGPVRDVIAAHREWFRGGMTDLATAAGLTDPDEVAASLVLLRDAALVGGYLDGVAQVEEAFLRTARGVIAAHTA